MEGQFCCWQDPAKKKIFELISGRCRWVDMANHVSHVPILQLYSASLSKLAAPVL